MKVEFEIPHLRALDKAVALLKGIETLEESIFMGIGCADRTLASEFLEELRDNMAREVDETGSRRVDFQVVR